MWRQLRLLWEIAKDMTAVSWWGRLWEAKDIMSVLWPARFSIGMLLTAIPFLTLLPPSQDALLALIANRQSLWPQFVFMLVCLIWALETFYWAQFMSRLPPKRPPQWYMRPRLLSESGLERLNKEVPRLIGALALVVVSCAAIKANWGSSTNIFFILVGSFIDGIVYFTLCWKWDGLMRLPQRAATRGAAAVMKSNTLEPQLRSVSPRFHKATSQIANYRPADQSEREHRNLFRPQQGQPTGPNEQAPMQDPAASTNGAPAPDPTATRNRWQLPLVLGSIFTTLGLYAFSSYFTDAARPKIALGLAVFWLIVGFAYIIKIGSDLIDTRTKLWVLFNFLLFTVIFIFSLYSADVLPWILDNSIAAPTVTLSVFAAWVFVGTFFIALPGERTGLPILTIVILLSIAWSFVSGDNHDVRLRRDVALPEETLTIETAVDTWYWQAQNDGPVQGLSRW
jgi:hypothetical protein